MQVYLNFMFVYTTIERSNVDKHNGSTRHRKEHNTRHAKEQNTTSQSINTNTNAYQITIDPCANRCLFPNSTPGLSLPCGPVWGCTLTETAAMSRRCGFKRTQYIITVTHLYY